jgi:hypothetical protein
MMSKETVSLPPRATEQTNQTSSSSTSAYGYVPPSLRKGVKKSSSAPVISVDMSSESFPTLMSPSLSTSSLPLLSHSSSASSLTKWNTSISSSNNTPISFKDKIDTLISFEKLSETEKKARIEARQAMEGFVSLPLKLTSNYIRTLDEQIATRYEEERSWNEAVLCGTQNLISLEPIE